MVGKFPKDGMFVPLVICGKILLPGVSRGILRLSNASVKGGSGLKRSCLRFHHGDTEISLRRKGSAYYVRCKSFGVWKEFRLAKFLAFFASSRLLRYSVFTTKAQRTQRIAKQMSLVAAGLLRTTNRQLLAFLARIFKHGGAP